LFGQLQAPFAEFNDLAVGAAEEAIAGVLPHGTDGACGKAAAAEAPEGVFHGRNGKRQMVAPRNALVTGLADQLDREVRKLDKDQMGSRRHFELPVLRAAESVNIKMKRSMKILYADSDMSH